MDSKLPNYFFNLHLTAPTGGESVYLFLKFTINDPRFKAIYLPLSTYATSTGWETCTHDDIGTVGELNDSIPIQRVIDRFLARLYNMCVLLNPYSN